MTWSHPRGYDPMVACSTIWKEKTGVEIAWDKRSLQDFESFPVDELAAQYDLVVIDHPHVGQITAENCLVPLDGRSARARPGGARRSIGRRFLRELSLGRATTGRCRSTPRRRCRRGGRTCSPAPATTWDEMMALAEAGRVLCPLRPPHSLMVFFTLAANLGTPCANTGPGDLIAADAGRRVLDLMRGLFRAVDPACLAMDPIDVFERMSDGRLDDRLRAADLWLYQLRGSTASARSASPSPTSPSQEAHGPVGSAIGGTGIAVSARCAQPAGGDRLRLLDRQRRRPARPLCARRWTAGACRRLGRRGGQRGDRLIL